MQLHYDTDIGFSARVALMEGIHPSRVSTYRTDGYRKYSQWKAMGVTISGFDMEDVSFELFTKCVLPVPERDTLLIYLRRKHPFPVKCHLEEGETLEDDSMKPLDTSLFSFFCGSWR